MVENKMINSVRFLEAGYTVHPEISVMKTGSFKKIPFPATVCVIEHSKLGVILFDTGYSAKFHEYTKRMPEKLYAMLTPVNIDVKTTAIEQLKSLGISAKDVRYIIVSHFHADHIGGLDDFPYARFIYASEAQKTLKIKGRFKQVLQGFIPQFLPETFSERSTLLDPKALRVHHCELGNFSHGWDVFNDGSIWAIPLPGHAAGHLGIYYRFNNKEYFLISDAAWTSEGLESNLGPSYLTTLIFDCKRSYNNTFQNLHNLWIEKNQNKRFLNIIPCHCFKQNKEYRNLQE